MVKKKTTTKPKPKKGTSEKSKVRKDVAKGKACKPAPTCGCGSLTYLLAFLGAAIYYISAATGFWNGVLGVLKAIIWPLFLVFEVMKYIGV